MQEAVTLQTARGRLAVFALLTLLVYISRYDWLAHLSLWQRIGIDWAPSIGLTRAYWLVLHGELEGAWHRNALIFGVLAIGIPMITHDAYRVVRPWIVRRRINTMV